MELSNFTSITDGTMYYYGGSQEWFTKKWHADAGCAATAAANLAAYYHLGIQSVESSSPNTFSKADFLRLLNLTFTYMTPHLLGFPNYRKFARKFVQFAQHQGAEAIAHRLGNWESYKEAVSFIQEALCGGNPIALLLLTHQDKQFEENTWHWMTVTGVEKDKIILSNYGRRESYFANDLFQKSRKNRIHLVWFEIKKDA